MRILKLEPLHAPHVLAWRNCQRENLRRVVEETCLKRRRLEVSSLLIAKICSCYFGKRLKVCCGNDESDDCVETASNCVDLWPISAHREGSDRRV